MIVTDKKEAAKVDDYQAFISSLELYMIGLAESSCEINRKDYWAKEEGKNVSFKLTSKPNSVDQKHFDARSTIALTMTGEKSKATVVKINAAFDLHFHAKPINKGLVDKFCESDIRLIVWPYFREYVTSTISRMHIPPILLPLSSKEE
jgi:preprotein translocase subunit SecB